MLTMTDSPTAVGVVTAFQFAPTLVFGLHAGLLADRFPKRHLLLGTQLSMMLTAAALAALTLSGRVEVWHVFLLAAVLGTVAALDNPVRQSFVSEVVDGPQLPNAISLVSCTFQIGAMAGPVLGGLLMSTVGAGWAFVVNALSFVGPSSRCCACAAPRPARRSARPVGPPPLVWAASDRAPGVRAGLSYAVRTPSVLWPVVMVGAFGFFTISLPVTLAAYAKDVFHSGASGLGLLNGVVALGALAGALTTARRRRQPRLRTVGRRRVRPGRRVAGHGSRAGAGGVHAAARHRRRGEPRLPHLGAVPRPARRRRPPSRPRGRPLPARLHRQRRRGRTGGRRGWRRPTARARRCSRRVRSPRSSPSWCAGTSPRPHHCGSASPRWRSISRDRRCCRAPSPSPRGLRRDRVLAAIAGADLDLARLGLLGHRDHQPEHAVDVRGSTRSTSRVSPRNSCRLNTPLCRSVAMVSTPSSSRGRSALTVSTLRSTSRSMSRVDPREVELDDEGVALSPRVHRHHGGTSHRPEAPAGPAGPARGTGQSASTSQPPPRIRAISFPDFDP